MARITDWTGITKTPFGYRARVEVRPFPQRSKRFPPHTTLDTMQRWRATTRRALELARPRAASAGTVAADVQRYLALWGAGKHPQTVAQRRRHLELFADVFGRELRALLTTADIETQLRRWQHDGLPLSEYARTRRRRQRTLTDAAIRKVRQSLYQLWATLDRGTGLPNPVADIPAGTDAELDPKGHPEADVRAVLAQLPRSKTRARCQVIAYVGLRPDEVRHLERRDWNGSRVLFVRSGKRSERKAVPLTRRGAAALRYFVQLDAFGNFTSAPANRMLKNAARAARLDPAGWTLYSLRHSFGTWHYAATHDVKATKEVLRQKTLRMTERYVRAAVSQAAFDSVAALDATLRRRR
jgi:integrase